MILNLPSNLFKVLIVNRHNLAMSWEGPEDKVAVFQVVSIFFFVVVFFLVLIFHSTKLPTIGLTQVFLSPQTPFLSDAT